MPCAWPGFLWQALLRESLGCTAEDAGGCRSWGALAAVLAGAEGTLVAVLAAAGAGVATGRSGGRAGGCWQLWGGRRRGWVGAGGCPDSSGGGGTGSCRGEGWGRWQGRRHW